MPPARLSVAGAVDHIDRIDADPGVLSRLNLETDRYVLFVGSLAPGKNLVRALAAVALMRESHPTLRFVIAGAPTRRSSARGRRACAKTIRTSHGPVT